MQLHSADCASNWVPESGTKHDLVLYPLETDPQLVPVPVGCTSRLNTVAVACHLWHTCAPGCTVQAVQHPAGAPAGMQRMHSTRASAALASLLAEQETVRSAKPDHLVNWRWKVTCCMLRGSHICWGNMQQFKAQQLWCSHSPAGTVGLEAHASAVDHAATSTVW